MKVYTVEMFCGSDSELVHAAPYYEDEIEDISPNDYNADFIIITVWDNGDAVERIERRWNE